jgi:hypothetical protein
MSAARRLSPDVFDLAAKRRAAAIVADLLARARARGLPLVRASDLPGERP